MIVTDGSDFSREAIRRSCRLLADSPDKSIKIVSVYPPVVPLETFPPSVASCLLKWRKAAPKQADEDARQAADEIKAEIVKVGCSNHLAATN